MNWFTIATNDGTAFVRLFDDIGAGFNSDAYDELSAQLGDTSRVELEIASAGGCTLTALRLFDRLRGLDVETTITGPTASAAVTVAMAAREIRMFRGCRLLVHPPVLFSVGTPAELRTGATMLETLTQRTAEILCKRTGQHRATVAGWLARDTWFDCEQALAVGLVDEIIEPPPMPCIRRASAVNGRPERTEAEALFQTFLNAFGTIETNDRERLLRGLHEWSLSHIREVSP